MHGGRHRENTVEAFAEARRLGADGVELDVRLTKDGALAVHHDAEVPGVGVIPELGVADLPADVPLLADVLAVCDGMTVNVEIKNAPADPGWDAAELVAAVTAEAIEAAGWTERVIVSSFQPATLRAVQAADERLALGALWGFGADPEPAGSRRRLPPGSGRCTPSCWRYARAGRAGPRPGPGRQHLDGQRAATTCGPWWQLGVDTVITDVLSQALAIAGGRRGLTARRVGRTTPSPLDRRGRARNGLSPGGMA